VGDTQLTFREITRTGLHKIRPGS